VKFRLGRCVATPAALRFCEEKGIDLLALLTRHASGDWGEVDPSDRGANDRSLEDGSRLLSVYRFPAGAVWVLTEAEDDEGVRNSTCVMLPDDY
jgi:hypothetical protein